MAAGRRRLDGGGGMRERDETREETIATSVMSGADVHSDDPCDAVSDEAERAQHHTTSRPRAHSRPTGAHTAHAPAGPHHATHPALPSAHPPRRTTTARPLRAEDTALVERTTGILRAIELVETHQMQALHEMRELELQERETARVPVTIVPGTTGGTSATLPAVIAVKRRPRGPLAMAALWSLVLITLAGVLHTVTAAGTATRTPSFAPLAARFGGNDTSAYGPWATTSGAAEALGIGGGAGPGVKAPGSAGLPVTAKSAPTAAPAKPAATSAPPAPSGVLPAPLQPWPPADPFMYVPGHPAFGVSNPTNYYAVAWGQCTWWAQWKRQDEYLAHMGNALYWLGGAAGRGYRTGGVPVAGATVVVQPGVQGAGGAGHVAHVEAVYPGGWFLVSEMNFYWNGGGWGRVDYRYMHTGPGIGFIY
jgi:surface antigen